MRAVPVELIECRAWNHSWERTAPVLHHKGLGARTLFLSCTRCGSEKYIDLGPLGELWSSRITKSLEYKKFLLDWPLVAKADARAELYRRSKRVNK